MLVTQSGLAVLDARPPLRLLRLSIPVWFWRPDWHGWDNISAALLWHSALDNLQRLELWLTADANSIQADLQRYQWEPLASPFGARQWADLRQLDIVVECRRRTTGQLDRNRAVVAAATLRKLIPPLLGQLHVRIMAHPQ